MADDKLPCGALMKRLSEILHKNANNGLAERGVTFSQMRLLIMLHEGMRDSFTMKELERYFDLTQATVAGLVSRLEKKELIEGFTDPGDRRIKRVKITPEGEKLCRENRIAMDDYEKWFLKSLSEEEQEELRRLLTKIYMDVM